MKRRAMSRAIRTGCLSVLIGAAQPAAPAWADPPRADPPASNPRQADAPPPDDALRGPKVDASSAAPTLVERDFEGRIKRLDIPPEEAALDLLDLDDATRAETRRILTERAAVLDTIVRDNLALVIEAGNARQAGDRARARELFRELMQKAGPLRERGRLADELKDVMPAEAREAYDRVRTQYWQAVAAEPPRDGEAMGEDLPRGAGGRLGAEGLRVVGNEIRRSYERLIAERTARLDEFLNAMSLPPEVETRVRNHIIDDAQKNLGNPSTRQRTELFQKIYRELDAEQREALLEYVRERTRG